MLNYHKMNVDLNVNIRNTEYIIECLESDDQNNLDVVNSIRTLKESLHQMRITTELFDKLESSSK